MELFLVIVAAIVAATILINHIEAVAGLVIVMVVLGFVLVTVAGVLSDLAKIDWSQAGVAVLSLIVLVGVALAPTKRKHGGE